MKFKNQETLCMWQSDKFDDQIAQFIEHPTINFWGGRFEFLLHNIW